MFDFLNEMLRLFTAMINAFEYMLSSIWYINILGFNFGDIIVFLSLFGLIISIFVYGGDSND